MILRSKHKPHTVQEILAGKAQAERGKRTEIFRDKLTSIVHKMHPLIAMKICIARSGLPKEPGRFSPGDDEKKEATQRRQPVNYQRKSSERDIRKDHTDRGGIPATQEAVRKQISPINPFHFFPSQSDEVSNVEIEKGCRMAGRGEYHPRVTGPRNIYDAHSTAAISLVYRFASTLKHNTVALVSGF